MIDSLPDRTLTMERVEAEIHRYRREAARQESWFFRERYIDRCRLDPFYILEFRSQVEDRGDDLFNEELLQTRYQHLRAVCMTRERGAQGGYSYWRPINKAGLLQRLENFLTMFREDYLQPPGQKGDLYSPNLQHEIFREKRFLYEIRSPRRQMVGVGPKKYAGLGIGAIRGQVTNESGEAMAGAIVELILAASPSFAQSAPPGGGDATTIARRCDASGLFWFSKVPPGSHRIRVRGQARCMVTVTSQEWFGNVKGWITDGEGNPVEDADLNLIAPDAEVFPAFSNASGKFTTGPLPAFPYILRIPDHLFQVRQSVYVSDAVIGGVLRAGDGALLAGRRVVLKRSDTPVGEFHTDNEGRFLFHGLLAGRYTIEVQGERIFARQTRGETIEGVAANRERMSEIELIAGGETIYTERTALDHSYRFGNVAPWGYERGEE